MPIPQPPRKSVARRRSGAIAGHLAGAAVFLGLGGFLGYRAWTVGGFWSTVGAVVCVVIALILGFASGMKEAPCPACGTENLAEKDVEFKPCLNVKCQRYLQGDGESLWLAPDDLVVVAPTFGAVLPEKFGWPEGSCVCSQPATRVIPITLHVKQTGQNLATSAAGLALGRIVVKTGGGTIVTVNTPHCDSHMDGAALESPTIGPLRILFRSHAFQQQFRKRNNVAVS